jgi:hypothetical protein
MVKILGDPRERRRENVDPGVVLPIGSASSGIIFERFIQIAD